MPKFNIYDQKIDFSVIKEFCRENGRPVYYSKDDVFVQQGSIGKYLGVVKSGYFKYTTLTSSGCDAVVGFAFEGEIVADYYNSFNGLPSEVTIIAGPTQWCLKLELLKQGVSLMHRLKEIFLHSMVHYSVRFIPAYLNYTERLPKRDIST